MRLRYVLAAVVLAAVAASARAQVGVYINPVFTKISNNVSDTGPFAFLGDGATSRNFGGLDFGAYYNISHGPGMKLGRGCARYNGAQQQRGAEHLFGGRKGRVRAVGLWASGVR